jgi:hypothetical protein
MQTNHLKMGDELSPEMSCTSERPASHTKQFRAQNTVVPFLLTDYI